MPRATVADLAAARRVLVYGVTGSGKSTAALALGERLGLPVHLVDEEIGWLPGWRQRDGDEQRALAARIVAREDWVLDSAYGTFRDVVVPRAQVVLGLDYPRWLSLGRLVRRTARRWATRERVCNGNVETLGKVLSHDSVLVWHVRSYRRKTEQIRGWAADTDGVPVLVVRHPRELERVLRELSAG